MLTNLPKCTSTFTAAEVTQLRANLTAANFTLPNMRQNMRNSKEVAAIGRDSAGINAMSAVRGVEAALPPPAPTEAWGCWQGGRTLLWWYYVMRGGARR